MAVTDNTPDLSLYYVVHRAMKGDAARLARAVAGAVDEDQGRALAFEQWYEGYVGELHDHHLIEDEFFFPALVAKVPVFDDQIPRIDRDHARLDELLEWTRASLRDLANGREPWSRAQAEASRATRELSDLLDTHLDFEDDDVLPLMAENFTLDEYEELEKMATSNPKFKQLLFTIPWAVDWATDEERIATFEKTPAVFRMLWRIRRRPYARLAGKVFHGVPKPAVLDGVA